MGYLLVLILVDYFIVDVLEVALLGFSLGTCGAVARFSFTRCSSILLGLVKLLAGFAPRFVELGRPGFYLCDVPLFERFFQTLERGFDLGALFGRSEEHTSELQ